MNWLVIVVFALLIIGIIQGWRRGFLRVAFSLVALFVLLIVVSILTPHISKGLKEHTTLYQRIEEKAEAGAQKKLGLKTEEEDKSEKTTTEKTEQTLFLPDIIDNYIMQDDSNDESAVSQLIKEYLNQGSSDQSETINQNKTIEKASVKARKKAAKQIGEKTADLILNGIAFIVAVIAGSIAIALLERTLDFVNEIPVLGKMNRAAGLFAGMFESLMAIWMILLVLTIIEGGSANGSPAAVVNSNPLVLYLYEHNFITWIWCNFLS